MKDFLNLVSSFIAFLFYIPVVFTASLLFLLFMSIVSVMAVIVLTLMSIYALVKKPIVWVIRKIIRLPRPRGHND